jgi:ABC-type Na+ efflux pump permease subunit
MDNFNSFGKILIYIGLALVAVGAVFAFGAKIPWFGRLPGDICIERKNFTLYFPLATSLLVSLLISLVLMIFRPR